ncbi:MAG: leucine-rich repeat protein [Oscillospiraceae bacterium]|nr:leucine-rich repeat protein [Oscillospiraceae bacterium]
MKAKRLTAGCCALLYLSQAAMPVSAETDSSAIWERFLRYDLCITDYSLLSEEERALCRFIFDTEQNSAETVRCERARRILDYDYVSDRLREEELTALCGIQDDFADYKFSGIYARPCTPDLVYLDGNADRNEYWLDDEGKVRVVFTGECSGTQYDVIEYLNTETGERREITPQPSVPAVKYSAEGVPDFSDFPQYDGDYYAFLPDGDAMLVRSRYAAPSRDDPPAEPIGEPLTGTVTIPESVDGHRVTRIAPQAFWYAPVTKVELPDTVRFIEAQAFRGCEYLAELNFPSDLEYIGAQAVYLPKAETLTINCRELYIAENGVSGGFETADIRAKKLGESALAGCPELKTLVLRDDLRRIGANAFRQCVQLESVTLPRSLLSIGQGAFTKTNLSGITIPPTVEVLGALPRQRGIAATSGIDVPATHPLTDDPVCVFDSDCDIAGNLGTEAERYAKEWNLRFLETAMLPGDVNLSGRFDIGDAVVLSRYLLHDPGIRLGYWKAADFDGSGSLNAVDLTLMKRALMHLI